MSSSMDKDIYRLVPYRFLLDQTNADICKLQKLTNLFPEMKAIIELELFKINNLSRLIDRLSNTYTVLTAIDNRDDALHIFLGPYHISLGPVIFGALRFKNISAAILAASTSKKLDNTNQPQKRRNEAVLRRFRRAARKIVFIKSIINQLRLASILTPYNQYELYTQGIYDLVLAGHIHSSQSAFDDEKFTGKINDFRLKKSSDRENSLLVTKFIKINTLLHLLSPTSNQQQQQSDNNATIGKIIPSVTDDLNSYTKNENQSNSVTNSATICCTTHQENIPRLVVPMDRAINYSSTHLLPTESRSKRSSRKKPAVLPNQNTTTNPSNLITNDSFGTGTTSLSLDLMTVKLDESKNTIEAHPHDPTFQLSTNQEDAFINCISSLLKNYLSSRQLTAKSPYTNGHHEALENSGIPLLPISTKIALNRFAEINEFDKLLQSIKIIVDDRLYMKIHNNNQISSSKNNHENLSHYNSTRTTITNNHHQKLPILRTVSYRDTRINEFNGDDSRIPNKKRKLDRLFKSASSNKINSKLLLIKLDSSDNQTRL